MDYRKAMNADPRNFNVFCTCGETIMVHPSEIGTAVRCPACGAMVQIAPQAESAARGIGDEMEKIAKNLGFETK